MIQSDPRSDSWKRALSAFIWTLIVFGGLCCFYLYFSTLRALVSRTAIPFVENVAKAGTIQGRAPEQALPDIEEEKERINILLLGIDQREGDAGSWRTDTMILISVDPATNSAAMLSIPRDLWVTIPGYGESRINMAHYLGDAHGYPGGGVALAKKTVWYALGVPVHYYVRVNFSGFEEIVDAIGGVTINVDRAIHDESYPDGNYGTIVLDIPAGVQHMDGAMALQFARSRHGTGDYDRMGRQQQVIMAVRDKVLSLDMPISSIPKLVELAGEMVKTDLTLDEIMALAEIAKRVERSNIQSGIIDDNMTTTVITPEKWMVEVPDWAKVRQLVDDLFPALAPSAAPTPSLVKAQLVSEGARIEIQNGTLVTDLANDAAQALRAKGFNVVRIDNADRFDHDSTLIICYADMPYTIDRLADELDVPGEGVRHEIRPSGADIDVRIVLGRDMALVEP